MQRLYKVTVDPELQAEQYPLLDTFARLAGGQRLSKIDLYQAYHQLEMEEMSLFWTISRIFKTTKTVNFRDDLFSTKRQQRNATQSQKRYKG